MKRDTEANLYWKNQFLNSLVEDKFEYLKDVASIPRNQCIPCYEHQAMKSIEVILTEKGFKKQAEVAFESLKLQIFLLKRMGLDIIPIDLAWHNVPDSDYNLFGDKGFFVLRIKWENPKTERT